MAKEVRYIVFNAQEVAAALVNLLGQRDPTFKASAIQGIDFAEDGYGEPTCVVSMKPGARSPQINVSNGDLMSAMLLFCKLRRIPLSVRAKKCMEMTEGELALVSTLYGKEDSPRLVTEGRAGVKNEMARMEAHVKAQQA